MTKQTAFAFNHYKLTYKPNYGSDARSALRRNEFSARSHVPNMVSIGSTTHRELAAALASVNGNFTKILRVAINLEPLSLSLFVCVCISFFFLSFFLSLVLRLF